MAYTLNEYYQLSFSNLKAPRIIVYPNNTIAASLLTHYLKSDFVLISVANCVPDGALSLPMPNSLLSALDDAIEETNTHAVVVGIDSYLSLLSTENVRAFFAGLSGRIDGEKLNVVYMVSYQSFPCNQFASKYVESRKIIRISGDLEVRETPRIGIVSDIWVKSASPTSYRALIKQLGDFLPMGDHTLFLKGLHIEQAGLGNNVSFILDVRRIAERFYGFTADLKLSSIELLLSKIKERGGTIEGYLETEFGKVNINVRLAVKRLIELSNDDIWPVYSQMIKKKLPQDTYMARVLCSDVTHDNFLRKYVVEAAVTVLNDNDAEKFATERAEALTGLPVQSLIIEFIEQTKNIDSAHVFLNCGTEAERIEILRRASKLDLAAGIPEPFKRLYPVLADYLSTEFEYGNSDLTAYFKEYRRLKIKNAITDKFVKRAYSIAIPTTLPPRDTVLADLRTDATALLIVDGMGAEYLPLLLALANRRNMNVESFIVASAKLPTSTEFNPIQWNADRTLDPVKGVDNIIHYGAEKHERNSPEQNIELSLRKFDEIFNRVAKGLSQYCRIVVTADHGSSRLAVLAHNEGLSLTLPWSGQPLDWRFSPAPKDRERPPEFEQHYHPNSNTTYWVVRGYNRLPKSGGKLNELHGGASLEERLVPIVVFTRAESDVQPRLMDKKKMEQIVDKMGFEI